MCGIDQLGPDLLIDGYVHADWLRQSERLGIFG